MLSDLRDNSKNSLIKAWYLIPAFTFHCHRGSLRKHCLTLKFLFIDAITVEKRVIQALVNAQIPFEKRARYEAIKGTPVLYSHFFRWSRNESDSVQNVSGMQELISWIDALLP